MNRKLSLLVAFVMLIGLALAGCATTPSASTSTAPAVENTTAAATASASAAEATATPSAEATASASDQIDTTRAVKWLDSQEPPELNPMLMTDVVSLNIHRHISEGLIRLGPKNEVTPGMAESWDVSADGLTYTFHLRDAKWSNGDPVTANDFEFSLKNILNPATGAQYSYVIVPLIKGAAEYNSGKGKVEDVGIKALDAKTLQVTLTVPATYFLDIMGFGVYGPVDEKYYNEVGADKYGKDADKMLYNGPYTMDSWNHEVGLVLKKNPNYWNAAAIQIPEIDMTIVKDSETALNMFLSGDLDIVGLRGAQVQTAKDAGFEPKQYGDGATAYVQFNVREKLNDGTKNPLNNKNLRYALSMALDRKGYISTVLKNNSQPATGFTTPEIPGKTQDSFVKEFPESLVKDNDPAGAVAALTTALTELGMKKEDLKLSMVSDDTDTAKDTAAYYKECWSRVLGIDVEILTMPFKSRLEKTSSADFMMSSSLWGPDYNDPMTELDLWVTGGGNNNPGYSNKDYDALIDKALHEPDRSKKFDLYIQAEKLLMTDLPIAPVYFRMRDYTTVPELKGVVRNANQDVSFLWAYFDKK